MEKKNLYVGNLPFSVNDQELKEIFSTVGTVVSAKVIVDFESQRSKGFSFVEMSTDEETQRAISEIDGKLVNGRSLKVSLARPKIRK